MDLSFDVEPPQGQDGHGAWFEIVVAGDAEGEAVLGGGDGRGVDMCAAIGKGGFCEETERVEGIVRERVELWGRGVWEGRGGGGGGGGGGVGEEGVGGVLGAGICRGGGARDHARGEAWVSDGAEDGVDCFFHFSERAGEDFVFPARGSDQDWRGRERDTLKSAFRGWTLRRRIRGCWRDSACREGPALRRRTSS